MQRFFRNNTYNSHTSTGSSELLFENESDNDTKACNTRRNRGRRSGANRSVGARMFRQSETGIAVETGRIEDRRSEPPESPPLQQKVPVKVFVNKNFGRAAACGGPCQGKPSNFRPALLQCTQPVQNIPSEVLDDICWRFLYNIPDNERNDLIRTCFQIEQAHWYYVDFFCKDKEFKSKCPDLGQRDFMKQVFAHCSYLCEYADKVDQVLEQWRSYKSNVPTYGAILLDSTLNYVLLIQGFYARSSWGFPKGKLNECEEPTVCAAREVEEEVGYDISEKISEKLFIEKFVNETRVRLYIVTDVPVDYHYAPKTRHEIGKIQWFSIWDLPTDRNDTKTSERIGYLPNNFYTALPFINDLREYVSRQQKKRLKKPKNPGSIGIGPRSASAFDPVLPQQRLESLPPILGTLLPNLDNNSSWQHGSGLNVTVSQRDISPSSTFFKPVSTAPLTFTGPSFMELISSNVSKSPNAELPKAVSVARPVPTKPIVPLLGRPVYQADKKSGGEKKIDMVPGPNIDSVSLSSADFTVRAKETSAQRRARRLRNKKTGKELTPEETNILEDIDKLGGFDTMKNIQSFGLPEIIIKPCEAWMNFKLDLSRITLT